MDIKLEPTKTSDWKKIINLMYLLTTEDPDELPRNTEYFKNLWNHSQQSNPPVYIYSIKQENQIVGYSVVVIGYSTELYGQFAEIEEIYIQEKYRGNGIGTHILNTLSKELLKHFNTVVIVATQTNQRAAKLYSNLGWKNIGLRYEFIKQKQT